MSKQNLKFPPLFFFFSKCYESYQCSQAALIYGNPKKHPKQTSLMRHDADGESYSKKDVLPDHFTGLRIEWENEQRKGKNPRGSFFCFFFTENFRKHETKVCFLSFSGIFLRVLKERKKDLYSPPSEEAADWKKTKRDMSEKLPSWPPALRKDTKPWVFADIRAVLFFSWLLSLKSVPLLGWLSRVWDLKRTNWSASGWTHSCSHLPVWTSVSSALFYTRACPHIHISNCLHSC